MKEGAPTNNSPEKDVPEPRAEVLEELRIRAGVGSTASADEIAKAFKEEYKSQSVDPNDAIPDDLSREESEDVMKWLDGK